MRGVSLVDWKSDGLAGLGVRLARLLDVVVTAPDIIVARQSGDGGRTKGQLIVATVEDGTDGAVRGESIGEATGRGGLEAVVADGLGEAHDPQNGAIALLGVWPGIEDGLDEGGCLGADLASPGEEA